MWNPSLYSLFIIIGISVKCKYKSVYIMYIYSFIYINSLSNLVNAECKNSSCFNLFQCSA